MKLSALPAFDDNYIWTLADDAGRAVIVDPGDAAPVLAAAEAGLKPVAVLVTHHHGDHIGGLPGLLERWPGLEVFAPDDARIPAATVRVGDGERIAVNGWNFTVISTPGHTRSHVSFHGDTGHLFCGDTLFSLGCGRLFEGMPAQMLASLRRLAVLPPVTKLCCAHEYTLGNAAFAVAADPGNPALLRHREDVIAMRQAGIPTLPSTLALELACNPFLRSDTPGVRASLATRLGREPADAVEAFAELRRWKDGFTA